MTPVPAQTADIRMVDVGDVRLRVSVRGSGPPVLLISGLGAGLELAAPFERRLSARKIQVISFDAPGIGGSTPYRWPRRIPHHARTVTRLLDALGHEQVDVVGVSLGGAVAQQLARQAPGRVRKLVLAATLPGLGGLPGSPHALLSMLLPRHYRDPAYYRQNAGRIYGGQTRRNPGAVRHATVVRFQPPSVRAHVEQLYAISGWSSLPWLHTLRQPTLVLAGDDDPIIPLVNARLIAWRIPNSRLHVVRGGGHLFFLEQPGPIADLVAEFLSASGTEDVPAGRGH
jgi:poly(3-hydroxyoctanoate) depolymerase